MKDMVNSKLRQRITELEGLLQKASTYQDTSPYECPLCGEIDETSQIPIKYCSLHQQIAMLEKIAIQAEQDKLDSLQELSQMADIVNEHRYAIDALLLALASRPISLNAHQKELVLAQMSASESKVQSMGRKVSPKWHSSSWAWMHAYTYPGAYSEKD